SECQYKGDCLGTCPKCEAELRYLEQELENRRRAGKLITLAGLSVALAGCVSPAPDATHALTGDTISFPVDTSIQNRIDSSENGTSGMGEGDFPPPIPPLAEEGEVSGDFPSASCTARASEANGASIQENDASESADYEDMIFGMVAEEHCSFPGGDKALVEYLKENIHYPDTCAKMKIEGRVFVTFTIEEDGSISDAKVVRSAHEALDAEAIRVVESMPAWNPGKQRGKVVRAKYTLPIAFKLKKVETVEEEASDPTKGKK
ncbi:MAG: energy transducer TonB, partial [Paludibacteraceae bacterium]